MRRRDFFPSICAATLAMPDAAVAAPAGKARFRPAICAYSFRDQLKDKSMAHRLKAVAFVTGWKPCSG